MSIDPQLREGALRLLARREHTRKELYRKLRKRKWDSGKITSVLDRLANEDLQSDRRFAEAHLRSRIERRYGPLRIEGELIRRGVSAALAREVLDGAEVDWVEVARSAYLSRFGQEPLIDLEEKGRRWRIMKRRGFTGGQLAQVVE
jgi:regulatory protein